MLLERELEMSRLTSLLIDARGGRGRVVFIAGEAGVGKSSLVAGFVAGTRDVPVAIGRCDTLATPRALGPFLDVSARLGLPVSLDRDGLLDSLLTPLRSGAATVLVIEDAHWADDASIELIGMLGRRAVDLPLLLIVTYRDDEVNSTHPLRLVIGDLVASAATVWMGLRPLSFDAVQTLTGDRIDVSAERLFNRTGGNPFYVTEALASPGDDVPTTVRLAVLARASRLDDAARAVLDAVAIVPGRAEAWLVEALCRPDSLGVASCVSAGVLVSDGDGYAFRHELARLTLWAEMPERRRRSMHLQAMSTLAERDGVDPARVVHHAAAAGDDAMVARWAFTACAAASARSAHPESISHGELALQRAAHLTSDEVADLSRLLAVSYLAVDRPDDAERTSRDAAAHWSRAGDEHREAQALLTLSLALTQLGQMPLSMAAAQAAVELLERLDPTTDLVGAFIRMTSLHMLARQRDQALEWGAKAIALASNFDDASLLGRALVEAGTADVMDARFEGIDVIRRGIALGRQSDMPSVVAFGLSQLGSGCGEMKRYDVAVPALEEGIAVASQHHIESSHRYQVAWLARCRFDLGQWQDVEPLTGAAVSGRSSLIVRFVALNTLGWLRARRGDDDVWSVLDGALDIARRIGHLQRLWPNAVARAEAGWLQGDLAPHVPMLEHTMALAQACRHGIAIGEIGVWLQRAGVISAPPSR
ncbi:MAG: transcriptional regulator, LuxR family, partial [Ilumatobacteraceae bacterium]|nr:transcriptional regulator, LuxR family [Ilumatobacteraceae bacterium]